MDEDVGIEGYLTRTPGIGGRIKSFPEDFVVEEIPALLPREEGGQFTVAWIRTRNWETNRLVRAMSRDLGISRRRIRFAGTKDKRAVTTQAFQFDAPPELIRSLKLGDVELLEVYQTSKRIDVGDLRGNRFTVVVRELRMAEEETAECVAATTEELRRAGGFPNFFGTQRFGSIRPITHIIGRHMVRGDFRAAVDSYVAYPIEGEGKTSYEARRRLEDTGDYAEALRTYSDVMSFEKAMLNRLVAVPGDYVGALQQLPFNLLMMFIHGYQSFLFNRILGERIRLQLPLRAPLVGDVLIPADRDGFPDDSRFIPVTAENLQKASRQVATGQAFVTGVLYGSESTFAEGVMGEIERKVIASEGLRPEDFTIPKMPRLSSKGTRRALSVPLPEMGTEQAGGAVTIRFELPRGCYATVLLREFMKVDPLEG